MVNICSQCGSYALNEHPESGLCDKCWWQDRAEKLEKVLFEIHQHIVSGEADWLTKICKDVILEALRKKEKNR